MDLADELVLGREARVVRDADRQRIQVRKDMLRSSSTRESESQIHSQNSRMSESSICSIWRF